MKLPVVGPAYQAAQADINNQRCVNMYLSSAGPNGRGDESGTENGKYALIPSSGLTLLEEISGSEMRCLSEFLGLIYAVVDNKVYKVTVDTTAETATHTEIGTISTSSTGTVKSASNTSQIAWVDGTGTGYIYTPGTSTFATINSSDSDFPGGNSIVFLDSYFIVNDPGTGQIYTSAGNNGNSWDPLDVGTAESSPDNIVALETSKGELWVIGERTTEIWYDAANASGIPLSPRDGLEMRIGCGAAFSVIQVDDLVIWLDNRGYIVQSNVSPFVRNNNSGYDLQIISTEAITAEILSYSVRSDAIACSYNDRGHLMYALSFPTAKKTWVYDYTTKLWHERVWANVGTGASEHHLIQYAVTLSQLQLCGGIRSGKIFLLKPTVYTEDSVTVRRIRTAAPVYDADKFGVIGIDNLSMRLTTGLAAGGQSPVVSLRYSNDGGFTWSNEVTRSIGSTGQYAKRVDWNRLGASREWVFEFTVTEPGGFSIIDATIDMEFPPEK
jgi:hypothetical protein